MPRQSRSTTIAILGYCLALLFFSAQGSKAQISTTGTINGTVVDASGAAVPGAKVTVTNQETDAQTTARSNTNGSFAMPGLAVGRYSVSISKAGFETFVETGVLLHPATVATVNAVMKVGMVSTRLTVSAAAVQVQTTTSEVSSEVSEKQVATLPLNGRNYQGLSALMPGVTNLSPAQSLNQGGFLTSNVISVNGMGNSGTLYTVDGIWDMNTGNMSQTTITPNPDTVEEVRVLQNNYSVQYNLWGTSVMLLQTKSGTDTFHGSAFEYLRNDALDARNFFSSTVPPLKQNIFGFTLGGPVFIPRHRNAARQRTFFFLSSQWTRQHIGSVLTGATPTAAMRNGTFNTPITNPATGQPFPQTAPGVYQIPANLLVPDSLAFVNAMAPLPNNGSGFLNYINLNPAINNTRDDEVKIDHSFTERQRLSLEYLDDRQINGNPDDSFLSGAVFSTPTDPIKTNNQLAQIQLTSTLTPAMVNTASIGMNNYVVSLGVSGITQQSQIPGFHEVLPFHGFLSNLLPQVSFSQGWAPLGVPTGNSALPLPHSSDLEDTFMDNWSWLHGKHYLQAGLNVVLGTKRQDAFSSSNALWTFTGQFTGNAIADFLLGRASSFFQTSNRPRIYAHYRILSPYVQDSWKATRRLTLSGGVRWEHVPAGHDQPGFETIFDPAQFSAAAVPVVNSNGTITPTSSYNPTNGLIRNGVNGVPLNFTNAHVNYFAPSAGFAWDVFGDGKTSLRGGYGLAYTASPIQSYCLNTCSVNPPLIQSITFNTPNFPNPIGAAVKAAGAPTLASEALNLQLAQVQTYSLSLQHQFSGDWLASIAGAGNIARHMGAQLDYNQPLPDAPYDFNPIINTGKIFTYTFAPYLGYGAINTESSEMNAYWDALELSVRHPVGHDLFLSFAYTWEHGLSEARGNTLVNNQGKPQDTYHPGNDYGNSSANVPQILTASAIWS
ncbi:MAG: carboxypeptidase regulatory-like domain-containing protein, partial [Terriglobia bacterium]